MELSRGERAWIWAARTLGGLSVVHVAVVLNWDVPTPAYVLIGGLLGGEFVYKASRQADE